MVCAGKGGLSAVLLLRGSHRKPSDLNTLRRQFSGEQGLLLTGGFAHAVRRRRQLLPGPQSLSPPLPLCPWRVLALQFATNRA